jgi:hypothetical protein
LCEHCWSHVPTMCYVIRPTMVVSVWNTYRSFFLNIILWPHSIITIYISLTLYVIPKGDFKYTEDVRRL